MLMSHLPLWKVREEPARVEIVVVSLLLGGIGVERVNIGGVHVKGGW